MERGQVLVTGASGFVGAALCPLLSERGWLPVAAARRPLLAVGHSGVKYVADIGPETAWGEALERAEVVVHLAARVHVMSEQLSDPLAEFRRVNTLGTLNLARQAAQAGVRRFIYLSSIKVNGEASDQRPFTERDPARPADPYAISKYEAELGLAEVSEDSGLEVVIIRPPLVYGPGVKANFARLMQLVQRGCPLPLGRIDNQRSLLALDNLVSFIAFSLDKPEAAGELFLLSDGEDISTPQLVQRVAFHMQKSPRLLPVSPVILKLAARLTGKQAAFERLVGSLQADSTKARSLGWLPPVSLDQGLKQAVDWYIRHSRQTVMAPVR